MREILFRGKCPNRGRWAYVDLFQGVDGPYIQYWENGEYRSYEVDPVTMGQYTGLTDKNGVKIFEGDVLLFQFEQIGEQKAIVEWSERYAGVKMRPLKDFQYAEMKDGEIIGNIHDGPKLLEEEPQC